MRKALYIVVMVMFAGMALSSCGGNGKGELRKIPSDTTGTAVIKFDEMEHDFGAIKEGEKVACIFAFTNDGDADLVIEHATASCGCTAPKYSQKPIPPGERGTVEVTFDSSGRSGKQTKTIMVQSNAANKMVILRILAEIKTNGSNK